MKIETLSDKIKEHGRIGREWYRLEVKDVKKFIEDLKKFQNEDLIIIPVFEFNKLAGPKLTNSIQMKGGENQND